MKFSIQATVLVSLEVEAVSRRSARDAARAVIEALEPTEGFMEGFSSVAFAGTSTKVNPNIGFDVEGSLEIEETGE